VAGSKRAASATSRRTRKCSDGMPLGARFRHYAAVTEDFDVRPSRAKRLIVGTSVLIVALAAIGVTAMLLISKPPSPVCDHVAKLAKADPRDADNFVDAIVNYAGTHLVKQHLNGKTETMSNIEGDTANDRCRNAMSKLEEGMGESDFAGLFDCLVHVSTTAEARAKCFPQD
jgi:hypothetical protein